MILWSLVVAGLVCWLIVRSGLLDKIEEKISERFERARLCDRLRLLRRFGTSDTALDDLFGLVA